MTPQHRVRTERAERMARLAREREATRRQLASPPRDPAIDDAVNRAFDKVLGERWRRLQ